MHECCCGVLFEEREGSCPECGVRLWEGSQASFKEAAEESLAAWLEELGWREGQAGEDAREAEETPSERVVELIETLGDYEVEHAEREAIVEGIVEEEDPEAIGALVTFLDHEVRHPYLRNVALRVLRTCRPDEAVPVLVEQWDDDELHEILKEYPSYPEMLVDAMEHGSPRSLEERREAAEHKLGDFHSGAEWEDQRLRYSLALHFGEQGDERAAGPLLEVLEADSGYCPWKKAAAVLGRLKVPEAIPLLLGRLTSENAGNHGDVLGALRSYGSYPEMLTEALEDEEEDEVRWWAAIHLAHDEGDVRAIPVLEEALSAEDETVRREAAFALAELDEREAAAGPLVEILASSDDPRIHGRKRGTHSSRRLAAKHLGEWQMEEALPALLELLADVGDWVFGRPGPNHAALAALKSYPTYPDVLEEGLEHPEAGVRYWSAIHLAEARGVRPVEVIDPGDVDRLIGELRSDDLDESWAAAWKLAELDARAAVDALVEQLGIPEKNYAQFATSAPAQFADEGDAHIGAYARALVRIGDPTVVPDVIELLGHGNHWVARDAAHVVRELADDLLEAGDEGAVPAREAVEAMIKTLKRSRVASGMSYKFEQRMRLELAGAIRELADEEAIPALEDALENETDTRVISALERSIEELR